MNDTCTHVKGLHDVTPSGNGCEDCLKLGNTWVHLRLCATCGHVGCCDDSKNKHATLTSPETLWFYWATLGWGIGLLVHTIVTFGMGSYFGRDWEEREIRKLMEKEN